MTATPLDHLITQSAIHNLHYRAQRKLEESEQAFGYVEAFEWIGRFGGLLLGPVRPNWSTEVIEGWLAQYPDDNPALVAQLKIRPPRVMAVADLDADIAAEQMFDHERRIPVEHIRSMDPPGFLF